MPLPPSDLPEPIPPPLNQPPRGRDRALSTAPVRPGKNALPPPPAPTPAAPGPAPYEFAPAAPTGKQAIPASAPGKTGTSSLKGAPGKRRHLVAWLVTFTLLGIALAITIPFSLGVYYGNQDRANFVQGQAIEHYQRALAYESETFTDLAIAELNVALAYKPDYQPALDHLQALKSTPKAPSAQVPQDVAIAEQLYNSAQQYISHASWNDAIDSLEELRRVKSDYQADRVTTQLVSAYISAGKDALAAGDVELASKRFEAALALDPNSADARTFHDRAIMYTNGTQAMGTDWGSAVTALAKLYQLDPSFGDVKTQLMNAYIGYGDFANTQGAYCIAYREYSGALGLGASSDIATKASSSNDSCKQAILNPTPAPTATPDGGELATPDGFTTPVAGAVGTPQAGAIVFAGVSNVKQFAKCNGTGDIKGAVQDAGGKPMANVGVKVYNDYGYLPPYARTDAAGEYVIGLGTDKGLFHLVVIDDFGSNASPVLDVDYPGGNVAGCHIVVNWKRTQ